jgi:oligopeptide transport system permease protein
MFRFIARRLLQMIPVLLIVATLSFFMIRLAPGGPFTSEKDAPPEIQKNLEAFYGFNLPIYRQFLRWLGNAARGDLGPSYRYSNRTVNELIAESFPISAELAFWSLLVALPLGLSAGIVASLRPNTVADYIPSSLAMIGISTPNFVLGPLLVLIFALRLHWLRVAGWDEPSDRI